MRVREIEAERDSRVYVLERERERERGQIKPRFTQSDKSRNERCINS